MKKLWQTGKSNLNPMIEAFETGDDLSMDQKLVKYDALASIAHAKMLGKIGILTKSEVQRLTNSLEKVIALDKKGKFALKPGDEDVHTAIENYLVGSCGAGGPACRLPAGRQGKAGKKIHTGRSRNDQVATALRLYIRDYLRLIVICTQNLIKLFYRFAKTYGTIAMPGYTHMQKAMPSTVGIWAGSMADSLKDDIFQIESILKLVDQSPLGSAAGYGSSLTLDRAFTAKHLGFARVQNNPLYCQNSRGKFEASVIAVLA